MPNGKRAGERCIQLTTENECALFGRPERPQFCKELTPSLEMCGDSQSHALHYLAVLEKDTRSE